MKNFRLEVWVPKTICMQCKISSTKNFRFEVWGPKPTCMPNFMEFWKGRV